MADPTNISLSNRYVPDATDTTGGHTVGVLLATDPDAAETFTYTITGGADQALFTIENDDELTLDDGTLDASAKSAYVVTVQAEDSNTDTFAKTFTILVGESVEGARVPIRDTIRTPIREAIVGY
jgi:hypothetical protein